MNKISNQKILKFIDVHYKNENLVVFTGSFSTNNDNKNSDVDLLIVTENYYYPFITKVDYNGLDFHTNVVPVNKIWDIMIAERGIDGPALCDMIAKGQPIVDKKNQFPIIQSLACDLLGLGPFQMSIETERHFNISISKYLQVIARDIPLHEKIYVTGDLIECFTKYLLLKHGMWPQSPKKRFVHLEKAFPGLSEQIKKALQAFYTNGKSELIFELINSYLGLDDSVHYSHSKRIDETTNYTKPYLCISLIGCETLPRLFEAISFLLNGSTGLYQNFYLYLYEDGKNRNGLAYYLILTNPDFKKVSAELAKIKSTFVQANSKVNFIFPDNLMGFRHEKLSENESVIPVFIAISTLLKNRAIDNNQPARVNFLLLKLVQQLLHALPISNTTKLTVLSACYQRWLAAAIDYTNTFTMDQIRQRKIWINESYNLEVTKVTSSTAFIKYVGSTDELIDAAVEKCLINYNTLITPPIWQMGIFKDRNKQKLEYSLNVIFDAFLIPDNQKAYLYLLISSVVEG